MSRFCACYFAFLTLDANTGDCVVLNAVLYLVFTVSMKRIRKKQEGELDESGVAKRTRTPTAEDMEVL